MSRIRRSEEMIREILAVVHGTTKGSAESRDAMARYNVTSSHLSAWAKRFGPDGTETLARAETPRQAQPATQEAPKRARKQGASEPRAAARGGNGDGNGHPPKLHLTFEQFCWMTEGVKTGLITNEADFARWVSQQSS